ncbi:hypothetical protein CTI12_AA597260 [Artemisia annua]|uniref:Uncharacterized protein n=1 Tax=Artemisia annua TaxID=35608 RepID=A0A2U1KIX5_ARTAN|nr:hypothetical protein CTI12_AA597260 [Artemisia annua]
MGLWAVLCFHQAPRSVEVFEEQSNKKIDVVLVKQEVKEVEARVTDGERTDAEEISNTLEEEKSVHEKEEVLDQQLVLPGDIIGSQKSNASKLYQSNPAKPKRRLRHASSVMLRNINILEFNDATEMPKQHHGKRGEKEDVGRKRTQGNISLLRLLKQNLHH